MPRPKPIQQPPPRRNSGWRFTEALLARVAAEARKRGLSANKLAEIAIEDWLKSHRFRR